MSTLTRYLRHAWKPVLVVGVIVGGWWTATQGVAGVKWSEVADALGSVDLFHLGLLAAVWLAGLGVYSVVLSAAMPGLGIRRSLVLNLSGSAVANVVPLGGAVATALNWRMARAWGHSDRAFIAFSLLTNILDVLSKLLLPLVAVGTLLALSLHVPLPLWVASALCGAAIVLAVLVRAVMSRRRGDGSVLQRRWLAAVHAQVRDSGGRIRRLFTRHWSRLVPASIGYVAAQVVLLYLALQSVGVDASVAAVLTAAAIERLGTVIPITPGGTGVAEVGAIAWLVASGLDPVGVVAGVLLYRVFLLVMEIPVGGALLGAWAWTQRASANRRVGEAAA